MKSGKSSGNRPTSARPGSGRPGSARHSRPGSARGARRSYDPQIMQVSSLGIILCIKLTDIGVFLTVR